MATMIEPCVQPTATPRVFTGCLDMQLPIPDSYLRVNEIESAHSYGMSWSRTWAMTALARSHPDIAQRTRFRRHVYLHIVEGMKRHDELKVNFVTYGHWVPQFAVYAVTDGLDLPATR